MKFLHHRPLVDQRPRRAPQGARGLKCSLMPCASAAWTLSRPARGAWVEIRMTSAYRWSALSRPARGAWVEMFALTVKLFAVRSRPARGAWVEITLQRDRAELPVRRAPQGARGLKFHRFWAIEIGTNRRAPQGARGLKCPQRRAEEQDSGRAPQGARGLKYR